MTKHSHNHNHAHATHPEIVKRLRRANGHLEKVIAMIGRGCTEVAQQMQAVSKAIIKAKTVFIHDHINGCLSEANLKTAEEQQKAIADFQEITKYLT
jgi:DNA-binding FrmR family transcriptional regulator